MSGTRVNIFPLILKVALGEIPELKVFGNDWDTYDGTGVRDYIHILDLADGHISALENLLNSNPKIINLNLGTGIGTSVLDLINCFEKVNNIRIPYRFKPIPEKPKEIIEFPTTSLSTSVNILYDPLNS